MISQATGWPAIDGYTRIDSGTRTVYVETAHLPAVEALGFVLGEATTSPVGTLGGRVEHSVYALPAGDGVDTTTRVLWKHCRRGGLVEPILEDRHYNVTRFIEELRLTAAVARAGIPVAPIIGLAIEECGRVGAKQVDVLSTVIHGARDVGDTLIEGTLSARKRHSLIREMAQVLRRFHGAGFLHGDLNLKNIVWTPNEVDGIDVALIDLDPGRKAQKVETQRHPNLLRLWRSYLKGERARKWELSTTELFRFAHTYFRGDAPALAAFIRRARRAKKLSRLRYAFRGRRGSDRNA
ncbi:MAG: lipopolysaccharide kinase InaA family protein [Planctomycetota bacterium]